MSYIDLNMVRAGIVDHPSKWKFGGYHEIRKPKERYKLIDHEAIVNLSGSANIKKVIANIDSEITRHLTHTKLDYDYN